uniref:Uncharacterized protein n=1 Tax=Thermogemmatispora argillosa TaxID=2045280 RepID=A0A455T5M1_9CHLR|nr:hypothetical protein KTA_28980 [Thermogemmatispora argillosa]
MGLNLLLLLLVKKTGAIETEAQTIRALTSIELGQQGEIKLFQLPESLLTDHACVQVAHNFGR